MSINIQLQIIDNSNFVPNIDCLRKWTSMALSKKIKTAEITIRIVKISEMLLINNRFSKKNKATGILTFPIKFKHEMASILLGDIIICTEIIEKEAKKQKKDLIGHWAHMIIHGSLHLIGYTHETNKKAKIMETLEKEALIKLGFNNPYKSY